MKCLCSHPSQPQGSNGLSLNNLEWAGVGSVSDLVELVNDYATRNIEILDEAARASDFKLVTAIQESAVSRAASGIVMDLLQSERKGSKLTRLEMNELAKDLAGDLFNHDRASLALACLLGFDREVEALAAGPREPATPGASLKTLKQRQLAGASL